MSDERSSSGSSVAMVLVAFLGGLLLVGCCGGVVVIGARFLALQSARDMEFKVRKAQETSRQSLEKAQSEMREKMIQDTEATRIAEQSSAVQPPGSVPAVHPSIAPDKDE
jgi:hypothetical protein